MSTNEYSIAFAEVFNILRHSEIEVIEKIPLEIIKKIREKSDKEYKEEQFDENNISPKAKAILAVLYQDYLCEDEDLEEFNRQIWENEVKYQESLKKKYNTDSLFKKVSKKTNEDAENLQMVQYKENVFRKIINKIKMLFKKN